MSRNRMIEIKKPLSCLGDHVKDQPKGTCAIRAIAGLAFSRHRPWQAGMCGKRLNQKLGTSAHRGQPQAPVVERSHLRRSGIEVKDAVSAGPDSPWNGRGNLLSTRTARAAEIVEIGPCREGEVRRLPHAVRKKPLQRSSRRAALDPRLLPCADFVRLWTQLTGLRPAGAGTG